MQPIFMSNRFFFPLTLAAAIFFTQPALSQNINELFRQGTVAQSEGKFSAAAQIFRTIISLEPNNNLAYFYLGEVLLDQGNLAEATTNYRTAIRLEPAFPEAYTSLCIALQRQGNLTEAISNCQTSLRLQPDDAPVYALLGISFYQQGNVVEAIDNFRTSLRLNQNQTADEQRLMNSIQNLLQRAEQELAEQQRRR